MDHMNLFNPFENKDATHEDVLTRNYLYLLRVLPEVREMFFTQIRLALPGLTDFPQTPQGCARFEVKTQVDSGNEIFSTLDNGERILSVLVSDDRLTKDHVVNQSARHARYDGVIDILDPKGVRWLLILENKPFVGNVWTGQLDLNLGQSGKRVVLERNPCCLSW